MKVCKRKTRCTKLELLEACHALLSSNAYGDICDESRFDGQEWVTSVEVFRKVKAALSLADGKE